MTTDRLSIMSDAANEEYIRRRQQSSLLNRSLDKHWSKLRSIPFRMIGLDKQLLNSTENWFYVGVFIFIISTVYFILFGLVN